MEYLTSVLTAVTPQDLFVVGLLVFLEGLLSLDNALVLALLARHLPPAQQKKALTYGMAGAIIFRIVALFFITELIRFQWVKWIGGGYLVFLGVKNLAFKTDHENQHKVKQLGFWATVVSIELADMAFAVDSILAAAALSPKLWVLALGGTFGIIMMRFAALLFGKLLDKYPKIETSAYLLVTTVGLKLVVDGFHFEGVDFHSSSSPAFWCFWVAMGLSVLYGFLSSNKK